MAVSDAQIWMTVGFSALLAVATVLAVGAYLSLRRMDDVLLRARVYMNRGRLFTGFLFLALGVTVILAIALAQLGFLLAAGTSVPSGVSTGSLALSFGLLALGFYHFYAMCKPPRAEGAGEPKA